MQEARAQRLAFLQNQFTQLTTGRTLLPMIHRQQQTGVTDQATANANREWVNQEVANVQRQIEALQEHPVHQYQRAEIAVLAQARKLAVERRKRGLMFDEGLVREAFEGAPT